MNALKANQEILERIKQINLTRGEVQTERSVIVNRLKKTQQTKSIIFRTQLNNQKKKPKQNAK
jgi:hypothetical protein